MSLRTPLRRTAFARGERRPGELERFARRLECLLRYSPGLFRSTIAPLARRRGQRKLAELLANRHGLDPQDRDVAAAIEAAIDAAPTRVEDRP